jgi:cyclohexadieny/prephenate dehydrogenase / 3-phosphoshikimate 1-carboxyvinyltransferase
MNLLYDKNILIIGLGLIGGSVARSLKQSNVCRKVLACGRDPRPLQIAQADGSIDSWSIDLKELVPIADIIVLAVPTLSLKQIFLQLRPLLKMGSIMTDVASVKGNVAADFMEVFAGLDQAFIPGHPVAGSEQSGYIASKSQLFQNRKVILTPLAGTDPLAVQTIMQLWLSTGAQVHGMSVARHDEVLAATSHLPHLLAYTLVNTLVQHGGHPEQVQQIFDYAAGGFADFTRIASSDPIMWRDVFIANKAATVRILDAYTKDLARMRKVLLDADGRTMVAEFRQAKAARDQFSHNFAETKRRISNNLSENIIMNTSSPMPHIQEKPVMDYIARPGGQVRGEIRVPGDKSISHRSIIFGAIAEGVTTVSGFLEGEDALHTLQAFRDMGVLIVGPEQGNLTIYGVGKHGLSAPVKPLYLGNSGTAMRLLCGLLAAQSFNSELHGDESLTLRPMTRVAEPLRLMGAEVYTTDAGTPPIKIAGRRLHGINFVMPMASAQVKSCIMLAALYADGETTITEPAPCRDHTERMLTGFAYPVQRSKDGRQTTVSGGLDLKACTIDVPADISSAAFFMVAAAITPGASLRLLHVGVNPTRTGIINLLQAMGADISLSNHRLAGGEPVADIEVRYAQLRGIEVPEDQIPLAIDEFPVFFIAAACAKGTTTLRGAEELRVKETDRIQAMADGLKILGIRTETFSDGIRIEGGQLCGGEVDSRGDHRIAMAFTVASLQSNDIIRIRDCANVATSFPGFVTLARAVGITVEQVDAQ